MARPRVLITRRWPDAVEQQIAARFDVEFNENDRPLDQADLAAAMSEFDVLCPTVCDRIDAEVIGSGDRVKLIANYGVGFDHIDTEAAKAKGIAVTNTPGVLTDATADISLTLILMAARRAIHGPAAVRQGPRRSSAGPGADRRAGGRSVVRRLVRGRATSGRDGAGQAG